MRVVDTSVWIEWLIGSPLRRKIERDMPQRSECVVPTIVQLELAKWLSREVGDDAADQMIAYTQKCFVAPLDTRTALRAAGLCRELKLATADAVVYATAAEHGADLLTCDSHFKGLPGVLYVAKA